MFQLIKIAYGRDNVPEPMLLPAKAGVTYGVGMALRLDETDHALQIATGDVTATHIALEDKTAKAGEKLLCYQILPQMLFEAPVKSGDVSSVLPGSRLQISADGYGISTTAASGVTVSENKVKIAFGALVTDTAEKDNKLFIRLN